MLLKKKKPSNHTVQGLLSSSQMRFSACSPSCLSLLTFSQWNDREDLTKTRGGRHHTRDLVMHNTPCLRNTLLSLQPCTLPLCSISMFFFFYLYEYQEKDCPCNLQSSSFTIMISSWVWPYMVRSWGRWGYLGHFWMEGKMEAIFFMQRLRDD